MEDYILSKIPFYGKYIHKQKYIQSRLNILKERNTVIKDYYNYNMSWEIIEEYLSLAYDKKFHGKLWGPGLRIIPSDLFHMCVCK